MDIQKIQQDFPILQAKGGQKPAIYLDSACQSLRPQAVMDAVLHYYQKTPACGGRSMHRMAGEVSRGVDEARAAIAKWMGASRKEEIVFTRNTTEGINLVANALEWRVGDEVILSDKEHNSNLIPWQMLAKRQGVIVKIVPSMPDNTFDLEAYEKLLSPKVKLVSMGWTSNLDGVTIPVEAVVQKAHRHGALVLLDAAQSAPHLALKVHGLGVDFVALSGHKILGPSGTGVLYGKYALLEAMQPFMVGGDTVASSTYDTCEFLPPPEKFEAGLQDYAGIMGLGAAVTYLQKVGYDQILKQERLLNELVSAELMGMAGLKIFGPADPKLRGGIVTFAIDGIDSHRIALMLDQMANIQVRSGQHCVHSWFHARKIAGSVRASFYFYNSREDADAFVSNLRKIRKVL